MNNNTFTNGDSSCNDGGKEETTEQFLAKYGLTWEKLDSLLTFQDELGIINLFGEIAPRGKRRKMTYHEMMKRQYEEEQYRQMREAYQTHTKEWEEFKRSYKHETSPEVKQMIDEMNVVCNALFPHVGG